MSARSDAPPVRIDSPYPILKIWQTNQPDWSGDAIVDLGAGPERLLLRSVQGEVLIEPLSGGSAAGRTGYAYAREMHRNSE